MTSRASVGEGKGRLPTQWKEINDVGQEAREIIYKFGTLLK